MEHQFVGQFHHVLLSPLRETDLESLRCLRNKNAVSFLNSSEISREQQSAWYQRYLVEEYDVMFRVATTDAPQRFIGAAALYDIDPGKKQAEFGRLLIDREAAGRNHLGYETTMCACEIGFKQLGLQRVYLDVYADNLPAVKTYLRAGFSVFKESKMNGRPLLYMEKNKLEDYNDQ